MQMTSKEETFCIEILKNYCWHRTTQLFKVTYPCGFSYWLSRLNIFVLKYYVSTCAWKNGNRFAAQRRITTMVIKISLMVFLKSYHFVLKKAIEDIYF